MPTFYDYFASNMKDLGLPAPDSLFGNLTIALGSTQTFLSAVDKFGTRVTVRELIGAGIATERLAIIGALSASFYCGAIIGSIAVALGRTLGNGTSIADVIYTADRFKLNRPWLVKELASPRMRWHSRYSVGNGGGLR
jgi:hypothetical protein